LLLKEGKVVACGNYKEITKTGFNIKDILDNFLSANEDKTAANKNTSPSKPKEKQKSETSPTKQLEKPKEQKPDEEKKEKSIVKLTSDEIDHGPVTFRDYRAFFAFSGGLPGLFLFLFVAICSSLC